MTDGTYTGGERSVMYRVIESLCGTAETNVTLCVNSTSIQLKNDYKIKKKKTEKEKKKN